MRWLNYQHLLYFWTVARTGSIAAASRELFVSAPAISTQLKALEAMFGTPLFARAGRGLELTDAGHKAYGYAEQIFRLGAELRDALVDEGRRVKLRVGLSPMTPKLLAARWLAPLLGDGVELSCREGAPRTLSAMLRARELDLVLTDEAGPFDGPALAECEHLARIEYALYARPGVVNVNRGFPRSLQGAPVLLPGPGTALRTRLMAWFDRHRLAPVHLADVEDGALLVELARTCGGVFAAPEELRTDLGTVQGLERLGPATGVHADVFVATHASSRSHPAVARLLRPEPPPRAAAGVK